MSCINHIVAILITVIINIIIVFDILSIIDIIIFKFIVPVIQEYDSFSWRLGIGYFLGCFYY